MCLCACMCVFCACILRFVCSIGQFGRCVRACVCTNHMHACVCACMCACVCFASLLIPPTLGLRSFRPRPRFSRCVLKIQIHLCGRAQQPLSMHCEIDRYGRVKINALRILMGLTNDVISRRCQSTGNIFGRLTWAFFEPSINLSSLSAEPSILQSYMRKRCLSWAEFRAGSRKIPNSDACIVIKLKSRHENLIDSINNGRAQIPNRVVTCRKLHYLTPHATNAPLMLVMLELQDSVPKPSQGQSSLLRLGQSPDGGVGTVSVDFEVSRCICSQI